MDNNQSPAKAYLFFGAALAWFAVFAQLYLIIINRTASVAETIARFLSFFTILTNILVALSFSFLLVKPGAALSQFFAKPATLSAITVYIIVVGIVYNIILRFIWNPKGLQRIVDEVLHTVIPMLVTVYWFKFVSKKGLKWNIFPWLIYPVLYCIYTLIRGSIFDFYPYPFIDAGDLGYAKVMINIAGLVILFIVISLLLVAVAKLITKNAGEIELDQRKTSNK